MCLTSQRRPDATPRNDESLPPDKSGRLVRRAERSAGSPWSPAAIFLNLYHHGSVKEKWRGEQAIRSSGLDYVIIHPYGLGRDVGDPKYVAPPPGPRGVEFSQGRETTGGHAAAHSSR